MWVNSQQMEHPALSSSAQLSSSIRALRVLLEFPNYLALRRGDLQFRFEMSTQELAHTNMHSSKLLWKLEFLFCQYPVDLELMSLFGYMQPW